MTTERKKQLLVFNGYQTNAQGQYFSQRLDAWLEFEAAWKFFELTKEVIDLKEKRDAAQDYLMTTRLDEFVINDALNALGYDNNGNLFD